MKTFKKFKTYLKEFSQNNITHTKTFNSKDVEYVCNALGLDLEVKLKKQLLKGMNVELEHSDITNGDPILTAKIALAHMREYPLYYEELEKIEKKFKN